jgi:hypothetical protein
MQEIKKQGRKRDFKLSLGVYKDWANDSKYFLTQYSAADSRRVIQTQWSNHVLSSSVHNLCSNMYRLLFIHIKLHRTMHDLQDLSIYFESVCTW